MLRFVDRMGAEVLGLVRYFLHLVGLLYFSVKVVWTERHLGQRDFWRQVIWQIYFTGVQAVFSVVVLALVVGVFAVVEGIGGLGTLSGAESLGRMVTVVVLRDVAPLLTGGVVIVRSVTAVTAELGVMRVQREIEALEVMGISPLRHLVTPRIFGGIISLFALNVVFNAFALVAGFIAGYLLLSLPPAVFFHSVLSAVGPIDTVVFFTKVFVGGLVIFLIGCYHGLFVGRASTEVPVAVSRASLHSLVFLVVLHALVTLWAILGYGSFKLIQGAV